VREAGQLDAGGRAIPIGSFVSTACVHQDDIQEPDSGLVSAHGFAEGLTPICGGWSQVSRRQNLDYIGVGCGLTSDGRRR